jgi:alkaline phosphatase
MMHALDYDRALGELLELDDTIRQTIDRARSRRFGVRGLTYKQTDLKKIGEYENTLIVVTADHGHGFVSRKKVTSCCSCFLGN